MIIRSKQIFLLYNFIIFIKKKKYIHMWYPKPLLSILLIPLWFGAFIDYPGKHCQIGRTLVFIVLPYILQRCCNTSMKRLILAVPIFFFDNFFSEAGCNADWPDEYTLVIYMFFAGDGFSLYVIVNFSGLWCFYNSSFVGNFFMEMNMDLQNGKNVEINCGLIDYSMTAEQF